MSKNIKNYANHELIDFLMDPDFKKWVLFPDQLSDTYWKQVQSEFPQQQELIEKASKIIKNLPEVNRTATSERAKALWDKIDEEISVSEESEIRTPKKLKLSVLRFAKYAAVVATVITAGWMAYHFQQNRKIVVATGNGENKEITLPDGSFIQLAPNSSVTYQANMTDLNEREVWAEGDVNFEVKHLNQDIKNIKKGERFMVHLNEAIHVQVLGTVFSISDRRGRANVRLESGSVKLIKANQELLLKPGESAVSESSAGLLSMSKAIPEVIHEWDNHVLLLNKTKISNIIEQVNDAYGVNLSVTNQALLSREIDGAIPLDNFDQAMKILSSITGGEVLNHNEHSIRK